MTSGVDRALNGFQVQPASQVIPKLGTPFTCGRDRIVRIRFIDHALADRWIEFARRRLDEKNVVGIFAVTRFEFGMQKSDLPVRRAEMPMIWPSSVAQPGSNAR